MPNNARILYYDVLEKISLLPISGIYINDIIQSLFSGVMWFIQLNLMR